MTPAAATLARGVASGVGSAFVGPTLGAALEAPEFQAAFRARLIEAGLVLAAAVALGVVAGRLLGGGK